MKILKSIKSWWFTHRLIIRTPRQRLKEFSAYQDEVLKHEKYMCYVIINPVIHDLIELEKNTWDKERVNRIKEYLIENFIRNVIEKDF